ncbi:MAG: hypothetical protein HRT88_00555 [Lentisphaeraceae bacterium]|nr:hypothetical protein [Lentisphaeraceae bacterium]
MKNSKFAALAIAGLVSGTAFMATSCEEKPAATSDADANAVVHDCSGKNECKGLGGCKVTAEKLTSLAKTAGTADDQKGSAHDCSGKNECKGLGGCKVTKAKLEKLKKAIDK